MEEQKNTSSDLIIWFTDNSVAVLRTQVHASQMMAVANIY